MSIREDAERLTFVPLEEATTPVAGAQVLMNRWWTYYPAKGLVWWSDAPQCERSETMASIYSPLLYPWAEVKFVPIVYVPDRLRKSW